jgi:hypothetical protein
MLKFCFIQNVNATGCTGFLQIFRGCRAGQGLAVCGSEHVVVTSGYQNRRGYSVWESRQPASTGF